MTKSKSAFSALEVRDTSVSGQGAFATRIIRAGACVCPVSGVLRHRDIVDSANYNKRALQFNFDWWLEEEGCPDDFINHSCSPNIRFSEDGKSFIALRNISRGEELFFDYSTTIFDKNWSFECACGEAECRGTVHGFEGLSADVQKRLAPISLPYIQEYYAAENILIVNDAA